MIMILNLIAFAILNIGLKDRLAHKRIQAKPPRPQSIKREAFWSFISVLIYNSIFWLLVNTVGFEKTRMYFNVEDFGIIYLIVSVILIIFLHDSYFYWLHRFMHLPRFYNIFHKVHHGSVNPTAFASLAFHPLEAIVEGLFLPMFIF